MVTRALPQIGHHVRFRLRHMLRRGCINFTANRRVEWPNTIIDPNSRRFFNVLERKPNCPISLADLSTTAASERAQLVISRIYLRLPLLPSWPRLAGPQPMQLQRLGTLCLGMDGLQVALLVYWVGRTLKRSLGNYQILCSVSYSINRPTFFYKLLVISILAATSH